MLKSTTNINPLKPKKRTLLRLMIGKKYYITKTYLRWIFGNEKLSKQYKENLMSYSYFSHRTPLLRQLKDVDMQLQYNKIINLKIAAERVNNIIVYPGETFSYWKAIGNPTKSKGYVEGMILFCGTYKKGIGGGLCQLSNLIYWMTIHTPLTVVERYRHSFDVFPDSNRTQPFGSGATCVYNYRDLVIKNETSTPFQLHIEVGENDLIGEWRCSEMPLYTYKVYEVDHSMKSEFWGGYSRHNTLCRKKYDLEGLEIEDEYITENHALMMYSPFLEAK